VILWYQINVRKTRHACSCGCTNGLGRWEREGERERNRKRQKEMWGRETSGDIKVRERESELGGDV
jgi:hypothetical protein